MNGWDVANKVTRALIALLLHGCWIISCVTFTFCVVGIALEIGQPVFAAAAGIGGLVQMLVCSRPVMDRLETLLRLKPQQGKENG